MIIVVVVSGSFARQLVGALASRVGPGAAPRGQRSPQRAARRDAST